MHPPVANRMPAPLTSLPNVLVAAGLLLAALGLFLASAGGPLVPALTVSILGVLETVIGAIAARSIAARIGRISTWLNVTPMRALAIGQGLILSIAARAAAGDGPQAVSLLATPLWLAGIGLVAWGCWAPTHGDATHRWTRLEISAVGLLTLMAFAVRAWDITHLPYVLSGDEGSAGLTAWEFRTGSRDNLLGLGWFSFPSLYFGLLSCSQLLLGRTTQAIRLVSSLAGALTIPALYGLTRQMFTRPAAIAAAAWLAAFHVHMFFSRLAYNNIFDGLLFVLAAGGLWQGLQSGDRRGFLLAGLALGFSQFFYTTGHLTPILLLLWTVLIVLHRRPDRTRLAGLACTALSAAAVVLPLALLYAEHPDQLYFTASRVSMLVPGWTAEAAAALGTTAPGLVLEQVWITALGLTVSELQGIYDAPGVPMLISVSSLFFFAGLGVCLARLRQPRIALWLLVLAATILAGGLSIQAPSSQRLLYLSPALAVLVVLPFEVVWGWTSQRWPRGRIVVLTTGAILLVIMMVQNLDWLFLRYFPREEYGSLNGAVTQEMIAILPAFPQDVPVYFFGGERMGFDSIPSLAYLRPEASAADLDSAAEVPTGSTDLLAIVLPEQATALTDLQQRFPNGTGMRRYNRFGLTLFDLWAVGKASAALPSLHP